MKNCGLPNGAFIAGDRMADNTELEALKRLVLLLSNSSENPSSIQWSLDGLEGMKRLVAAMTIVLIDLGGTTPGSTCDVIAGDFPNLYHRLGEECILALCEEIQHSEVPEQSAQCQEMFRKFNLRYFAGRLPEYRVFVVYDVWYWETTRCGYQPTFPSAFEGAGFVDFAQRRIFIRFLPNLSDGWTMAATLLHEMAHAATGGDHDEYWISEMSRLKLLGAPIEHGFEGYQEMEPAASRAVRARTVKRKDLT